MSRYYRVNVECKGITEEQLLKCMVEEFGWEENDNGVWDNITHFEGEGNLCGGQSEEEAHKQIYDYLKKINPKAKINTRWIYLEDLPSWSYGDVMEE